MSDTRALLLAIVGLLEEFAGQLDVIETRLAALMPRPRPTRHCLNAARDLWFEERRRAGLPWDEIHEELLDVVGSVRGWSTDLQDGRAVAAAVYRLRARERRQGRQLPLRLATQPQADVA